MITVINITIAGYRLMEGAYFYLAFVYAVAIFYAPVTDTEYAPLKINFALILVLYIVDENIFNIIQVDDGMTPKCQYDFFFSDIDKALSEIAKSLINRFSEQERSDLKL